MDDRDDRKRGKNMSWREVDQIRDKSQKRDRDPMQKQSSPAAINAQKSYRAALEKAFANGTVGELAKALTRTTDDPRPSSGQAPVAQAAAAPTEATPAPLPLSSSAPSPKDPEREAKQKMVAKIREAEGRDPITRAVDAYLAKYAKLPDDYELLTKCLGHKNDDQLRAALDQLVVMIAREKPRRGRTLAAQLRFLEDTHGDPEIRTYAAQVRGRL